MNRLSDFYYELFDRIFTLPFQPYITERLRRDAVARQVQEAAGAASQALTRFLVSERSTKQQVTEILESFKFLYDFIKLSDIANPNRTPEELVEEILKQRPCPPNVNAAGADAVYRVALHLTVQVLMLVGPVMTEWQRLTFSTTYEMPRRIVTQLNQISEGLKVFASVGQAAADRRYELAYRDHLLQRFYRVEAGTVRMTTNLNVDLRELFVMPRLKVRSRKAAESERDLDAETLMNLAAARAFFRRADTKTRPQTGKKEKTKSAIEQVRRTTRNVIIGVPGSGKSTFLEWLQLSVANVDEELIAGRQQAIPLLLRVRQLDPKNLPTGAELVEKATGSRDRAILMPPGWIDRQMKAGRILFMLDGLDETEPSERDEFILPWLAALCIRYPKCLCLVSSRPVGYPSGALNDLKFAECELQDFTDPEIAEYARHWCTAIRLAQNEPDEEARNEGAKEGNEIVAGFKGHPYIGNLARNPLMLSAICLVNYFEGGQLPKDRAVLYRLCVEGLLHHWDQRRGIHSEYSLDEKLRVCREVAIAMQADDKAEYDALKVLAIFTTVLRDQDRANKLLEHIRYRTGLLIERRAGVFAFAHLTFQEYLAARAVYEGNHLKIKAAKLAKEHSDSRWNEVIALYCGLAAAGAARMMIQNLIKQPDSEQLAAVLAEAFLSSRSELSEVPGLRTKVLRRLAFISYHFIEGELNRFSSDQVTPIVHAVCGTVVGESSSGAFRWLYEHPHKIDASKLIKRLRDWRRLTPVQAAELIHLVHYRGADALLTSVALDFEMYKASGPTFFSDLAYESLAEIASFGLWLRLNPLRGEGQTGPGVEKALLQCLRVMSLQSKLNERVHFNLNRVFGKNSALKSPSDVNAWPEFISVTRQVADLIEKATESRSKAVKPRSEEDNSEEAMAALRRWTSRLERAMTSAASKSSSSASNKSKTKRNRPRSVSTTKKPPTRGAKHDRNKNLTGLRTIPRRRTTE